MPTISLTKEQLDHLQHALDIIDADYPDELGERAREVHSISNAIRDKLNKASIRRPTPKPPKYKLK